MYIYLDDVNACRPVSIRWYCFIPNTIIGIINETYFALDDWE